MKNINILLVDDQTIVRVGIRRLIEQISGLQVVSEARDAKEALERIKSVSPDVILMDVEMPGLDGLAATEQVMREFPAAKVIILSCHAGGEHVLQAIRAGAKGYIPKDSETGELELAIRCVARNQTYISPGISKRMLQMVRAAGKGDAPEAELTARQRDVLKLIAEGKTTKEIAFLLNLSPKTVETHRAQLTFRLGIRHVPGLVRYAMRTGLVPPEPVAKRLEFGSREQAGTDWAAVAN